MMQVNKEQLTQWASQLPTEFIVQLERILTKIFDRTPYIELIVREFVDATDGAVVRYLPNGATNSDKDYQYVKTDVSVNTVTIYPFGAQLINATTSLVLSSQGDSVHLIFDKASQTWWSI